MHGYLTAVASKHLAAWGMSSTCTKYYVQTMYLAPKDPKVQNVAPVLEPDWASAPAAVSETFFLTYSS